MHEDNITFRESLIIFTYLTINAIALISLVIMVNGKFLIFLAAIYTYFVLHTIYILGNVVCGIHTLMMLEKSEDDIITFIYKNRDWLLRIFGIHFLVTLLSASIIIKYLFFY